MQFLDWKWLRPSLWLSLSAILLFSLTLDDVSTLQRLVTLSLCSLSLFNGYIEYLVSAVFISPGNAKASASGEHWTSQYGMFKGVKLHVQTFASHPDQPLAIVIHGWRSTSASVVDRAQWFVDRDWNVVMIELPGHGQSTPIPRWNAITAAGHVQHHLQNIHDFIEVSESSPVFLYGHSMGGYLCSRLASMESPTLPFTITGVILESPLMLYSHILEEICQHLWIPKFLRPLHLKRLYRDVQSMHPGVVPALSLEQFDIPHWGLPNAPTLCLQAKHDNRLGQAHSDALESRWNTEHELILHRIEGLTHSGARVNDERNRLLGDWLQTFDSFKVS